MENYEWKQNTKLCLERKSWRNSKVERLNESCFEMKFIWDTLSYQTMIIEDSVM